MSRLLLDTHVFVWWTRADSKIRQSWVDEILDDVNSVYVSAVTAFEIETKKRIRKIDFDDEVAKVVSGFGFEQLSMTMAHASAAGALDWDHRDPFDRLLVAQAIENDMVLVTADAAVKSAPGVRVL
jgi:PIN domain nuclease of toxin-antitoxin system